MFRPCIESCLPRRVRQSRELQRSNQANRNFPIPLTLYNYIVKFKIIRSIANSYKDKLQTSPSIDTVFHFIDIFTHIRIFRNIQFLSLAKSARPRQTRISIGYSVKASKQPSTFSSAKYFPYRDDSRSPG